MVLVFFIAGMACILYGPLKTLGVAPAYVCVGLGTFGADCAFNLVFLVTSELFPTVYRGRVFGLGNMMARVGGIVAPLVPGVVSGNFMYIFGGLGVVSSVLSILLK